MGQDIFADLYCYNYYIDRNRNDHLTSWISFYVKPIDKLDIFLCTPDRQYLMEM